MNTLSNSSTVYDSDRLIDKLIGEYDETYMPLPDIESEPHLLISKVRKHYMEYIIKLLSTNYEKNHKLLNKNIYQPSAIWRCAKFMEMKAAQTCMVVHLYQQNIGAVITEIKKDTEKGKLNKKLFDCLSKPPENEKKLQTKLSNPIQFQDCNCQCLCKKRKRRRKTVSPKTNQSEKTTFENGSVMDGDIPIYKIPVIANLQVDSPKVAVNSSGKTCTITYNEMPVNVNENQSINQKETNISLNNNCPRFSVDSNESDEIMQQLEKLFQCNSQEDDLFESALCDNYDTTLPDSTSKRGINETQQIQPQDSIKENHAAQIQSLDERLASMSSFLLNTNDNNASHENIENQRSSNTNDNNASNDNIENQRGNNTNDNNASNENIANKGSNNKRNSKWLCEEYFQKSHLFELLDEIGDSNRRKLDRVKLMLTELFGEESEYDCIMSPLEETSKFVISCKERIAPWVVKLLTPCYINGRIRGKVIFKALAKHLIRLIYQCSPYPHEYEVKSFVLDFLENHKRITCEADFKQFRIDNL